MKSQQIIYKDLGRTEYQASWDLQEQLLRENIAIKAAKANQPVELNSARINILTENNDDPGTTHYLLFTEHPPVYTLGKSGKQSNVLLDDEELKAREISFFHTNRGGDITFHGPGQIVGYPIIDLECFYTDIGRYLRELEEVIIRSLTAYGIKAGRSNGETGVWIDAGIAGKERKICAMGVRCSRWITMHGFALNVNTDLSYFDHIIPCGIPDKQVTSIARELGREIDIEEVKDDLKKNFAAVFGANIIEG